MQQEQCMGAYSSKTPYEHSMSLLASQGKVSSAAVPYRQVTAAVHTKQSQHHAIHYVYLCTT